MTINPYRNQEKSARGIATAETLARWAAVLFTSIGTFIYARDLAARYLPEGWGASPTLAFCGGLVGAAIAAWLTDMMFGELLQRVTYDALASRHPNVVKWQGAAYFRRLRRAESVMFALLLFALLAFDVYTTVVIRDPVADQARQSDLIDVEALRLTLAATRQAEVDQLRGAIKEKEKTIADTERKVAGQNPALARLRADGNAWASTRIAKSQTRATAVDQKSRAALEGALATHVAETPAYIDARIREAEQANADARQKNQRNRAVLSGLYLVFTLIPKALAILLRVLMVVSFLAYSVRFNPDLNGDGIIDYQDVEEYHRQRQEAAEQRRAAHRGNPGAGPAFP